MNNTFVNTQGKKLKNDRFAMFEPKSKTNPPKKEKENDIKQSKTVKLQNQSNLNKTNEENKNINNNKGPNISIKTIQKDNNDEIFKKNTFTITNTKIDNKINKNEEVNNVKSKANFFNSKENKKEKKENTEKSSQIDKNINNQLNKKEINVKDNKDNKNELSKPEENKNIIKENTSFQDRINKFNQNNKENNKNNQNFDKKEALKKETVKTNIKNDINEQRTRSVTINENFKSPNNNNNNNNENKEIKNINKDNKTKAEIIQEKKCNENSNIQKLKENYEKKHEKELIKDIKNNKEASDNDIHRVSSVMNKKTIFDNNNNNNNNKLFGSKNKDKNENKKKDIIVNNNNITTKNNSSVKEKIMNIEKKNTAKKPNVNNEISNKSIQKSKIEELLAKFQPNPQPIQDKKINNNNNLNNNTKKNNNFLDKINNFEKNNNNNNNCKIELATLNKEMKEKKEKEKKEEKKEVIPSKTITQPVKNDSDVQDKNKNYNDGMCIIKSIPKKFNIDEYLKNMNKDNSKMNEKRKQEIIKLAQKEKEESIKLSNEVETEVEVEIESDNENEEKELDNIEDEDLDKLIVDKETQNPLEKDIFVDNKINIDYQRKTTVNQKLPISFQQKESINNEKKINEYVGNNMENNIKKLEKNIEAQKRASVDLAKLIEFNKPCKTKPIINDLRNTISYSDEITYNSKEEEIFLEKCTEDEKKSNESFCECFFLSSFSKDKGQLVDNSEDLLAECNHPFCSVLPAMQPEIIYKYPKEDIKGLEINNLAASICFPNGIKVCYEIKEEGIKTVNNYRSSFTNQTGDRFFAVVYHFFLKMESSEYVKSYNFTSMKYKLSTYENGISTAFDDENTNEVYEKLKKYKELDNRDYVYIPYCACLVSRYPFINQMEKCLESIMLSINDNENSIEDLNKLIAYIVKSIPIPCHQSKVYFPLPYYNQLIEISEPYFKDMIEFGDNPIIILHNIPIDLIYCLFKLIINEQKILIVGKNNDLIAQIILNFVSLLYPFEWLHTFIPIMSEKMLKFLQAFLPFFNGMNFSLFSKAKPLLAKAAKGVFIYNIEERTIDINSNYINNVKPIKTTSYIHKHFHSFPKNVKNLFYNELKTINVCFQKQTIDKRIANLKMKNLFIHIFVELMQDYKKYSYVIDDYPVFNSFLFVEEKKKDKGFFKEFSSTQMFQMFIQKSLFENKEAYFQRRLSEYIEGKKTCGSFIYHNTFRDFESNYSSFFNITKKYIIKPEIIKGYKEYEEKEFISKKKSIKLYGVSQFLSNQFQKRKAFSTNFHGVLLENKRIINKSIELNNNNDPKNINYYVFPDQGKDTLIPNKKKYSIKSTKFGVISENDNKKNNIILIPNNENTLTEDEKDEIKDEIREIMARIYRSDAKKINEDKKNILRYLKTLFGREYFINIIFTGKNDIKYVSEESYDFFCCVLFDFLLTIIVDDTLNNIICALKVLKSCLYLKTNKNKKEYVLSDDLYCKLENYSLITKRIFWEKWVEDEMTTSDIEILKLKEGLDSFNNDDYIHNEKYKLYKKHSYDILEELPSIMMKMKIQNSIIIQTFYDLTKKYIFDDKQYNLLMHEMIDEIKLFQKCIK